MSGKKLVYTVVGICVVGVIIVYCGLQFLMGHGPFN